jgi:hypothetical protein
LWLFAPLLFLFKISGARKNKLHPLILCLDARETKVKNMGVILGYKKIKYIKLIHTVSNYVKGN